MTDVRILEGTISLIGKNIVSKENPSLDDIISNRVHAKYILERDIIYLVKYKNGKPIEKVRIGKKWWWERIIKYTIEEFAKPNEYVVYQGCPISCGLCSNHKNPTALLNIVVTNRCDLRCEYCSFYSERAGYVYEPSREEIKKMIINANRFYKIRAVQLTGGEPLLRKDLVDIIKDIKSLNVKHIQLNTNLVQLGIDYYYNPSKTVKFIKEMKLAGLNTIYTPFDGLNPKINFKNYYEFPFALEALREAGFKSVVLVPTLINKWNFPGEVDKIIIFAAKNRDIIRGVNFQPVSFVDYIRESEIAKVEKLRVTISDLIEVIEAKLNIPKEAWYPVPAIVPFLKLLGKNLGFYNNPKCGMATYVFYYDKKFYPITDFIDIDKIYNDLRAINSALDKVKMILKFLLTGRYFIQKELPDGTNIKKMLLKLILRKSYKDVREFHYKFLFLGTMHFMDPFNYDIKRVERCCIHYAMPNGRVIPFCTYNVFPSIYRDNILRRYSLDFSKAEKLLKESKVYSERVLKFREEIKEINHPIYKKYYS